MDPRAGLDAVDYRKSLGPAGNRTPAFQPAARRYSDCAFPAPSSVFTFGMPEPDTTLSCSVGSSSDLHSRSTRFESRPEHRLFCYLSLVFLSLPRDMWGQYRKLDHDHFLPIHHSLVILSFDAT
jgi:hypothetical protein